MSPDSQDNFVKVYLLERLTRLKAQMLHRAAQGRIAAIAAAGGTVCAASDDLSVSVRHRVTVCCVHARFNQLLCSVHANIILIDSGVRGGGRGAGAQLHHADRRLLHVHAR